MQNNKNWRPENAFPSFSIPSVSRKVSETGSYSAGLSRLAIKTKQALFPTWCSFDSSGHWQSGYSPMGSRSIAVCDNLIGTENSQSSMTGNTEFVCCNILLQQECWVRDISENKTLRFGCTCTLCCKQTGPKFSKIFKLKMHRGQMGLIP